MRIGYVNRAIGKRGHSLETNELLARRRSRAEIYGQLGVAKAWQGEGWDVLHVGTGFALKDCVRTKKAALEIVRKLRRLHSWEFTDPMVIREWPMELRAEVMRLIK